MSGSMFFSVIDNDSRRSRHLTEMERLARQLVDRPVRAAGGEGGAVDGTTFFPPSGDEEGAIPVDGEGTTFFPPSGDEEGAIPVDREGTTFFPPS